MSRKVCLAPNTATGFLCKLLPFIKQISKMERRAKPVEKTGARYRSDIDGLRAIAVLLVLGNHLGVPWMRGGFIGVDIFFVISGYLITGIVARDIAMGRFSLGGFYERRIRRIFPALLVVLAASTLGVYLLFPPAQLVSYCYSLLSAVLSYANLYFTTQSGYFTASYTKILQHAWSLGVEEQFYLILPLSMLFFVKKSQRAAQWFVGICWMLSFAWSCVMVFRDLNAAFYSPTVRAWELLSGSALALGMIPSIGARWFKETLGGASLLFFAACSVHYSNGTLFPGPTALPICVATLLLLKIGEKGDAIVTRLLRWQPLVFIGLISYSLYLWHWPLLEFVHLGLWHGFRGNTRVQQALMAGASIAVATLSWRLVEQPFRTGRWAQIPRQRVFALAVAAILVFAVIASVGIADHGLAWRFPPEAATVGRYLTEPQEMRTGVCFYDNRRETISRANCLTGVGGKTNLLLLGDSHAAMFWSALKQEESGVNVMQLNAAGCKPIPGKYDRSNCGRVRRYLFEQYLPTARLDAVVLCIRWSKVSDVIDLIPILNLLTARHVRVYVIGPVPEYEAPLPLLLALSLKWGDPTLAQSRRDRDLDTLDKELAQKFEHYPGVTYLSAFEELCHAGECQEYVDNAHTVPVLVDDNHLSNAASLQLVSKWAAAGQLSFKVP
jgi:peptidoglycan/LPS O-acetylase OafA/YrhL